MALSGQMDDAIHLFVLHQLIEGIEVADVHLDKLVVGLVLDVLQIGEVAGIGQFVEVNDVILGILVHEQAHHVTSDEACAASNDDVSFHICKLFINIFFHYFPPE